MLDGVSDMVSWPRLWSRFLTNLTLKSLACVLILHSVALVLVAGSGILVLNFHHMLHVNWYNCHKTFEAFLLKNVRIYLLIRKHTRVVILCCQQLESSILIWSSVILFLVSKSLWSWTWCWNCHLVHVAGWRNVWAAAEWTTAVHLTTTAHEPEITTATHGGSKQTSPH